LTFIVIFIYCVDAGGQTTEPVNVAVEVGSTVRLRCWISSGRRVHWDNFRSRSATVPIRC